MFELNSWQYFKLQCQIGHSYNLFRRSDALPYPKQGRRRHAAPLYFIIMCSTSYQCLLLSLGALIIQMYLFTVLEFPQ